MEQNPYSFNSAASSLNMDAPVSQAEEIRKKFLSHEASVKSIGILYILGGILGLLVTPVYFIGGISALVSDDPDVVESQGLGVFLVVMGVVALSLTVLQFWAGIGVRNLNPVARIGAGVVAAIGLLGFPLGTLISAYFLYLLFSQKGVYVFSPEYKEIIAQTPHIKYKTSIVVWILLALLILVLVLAFSAFFVGSRR